ncbi:MAG: ATP-binding cassette domain-containing protein [Candidatus Omnitrophica bacterium]|nr:ATP-binding cassette domain-containing protein [Candidatus Omnitrophota bacterium]
MRDYIRLLRFLRPHLWVLLIAVIFMLLFGVFEKASLWAAIPFVDNILSGKAIVMPGQNYAPQFVVGIVDRINMLASRSQLTLLYWILGVLGALLFLREATSFFKSYFMRDLGERVIRDIKAEIYDKFLSLSLGYYSKHPTGKLVSRITYDATLIRDSITSGLTDLFDQPIQILLGLFVVAFIKLWFNISWALILLSIGVIPAILYPVRQLGKKLKKLSKQSQDKMGDINVNLYETISGMRIVKAFSMEDYENERFRRLNQQFYKLSMKIVKRMEIISPISECAIILCTGFVIFFAGRNIIDGNLSPGAFIVFVSALALMAKPMKRLARVYGVLQTAVAAGIRIFEVLDEKIEVSERPDAVSLSPMSEGIIFERVSFNYGDKDVLKGVSFDVSKGEIIAFVGPSGVGKTTLVNLIPRFYDATKGRIKIDGVDIKDATLKSLRDQIGIVTQDTILFNDTVSANIAYGRIDNTSKANIIKAAKIANAHDFIMRTPDGYDTIIGERGFRLSGGEKQRLAIARAIFKNPPILILDEATSQLDTESEQLVQRAIDRLMEGRTVFVIAHRLSTIKHATRIFVMDKGNITEQGGHAELMEKRGLYKKLYEMQFKDA